MCAKMIKKGFWGAGKPKLMSQIVLEYLGNYSEIFVKQSNLPHFDNIDLDRVCLQATGNFFLADTQTHKSRVFFRRTPRWDPRFYMLSDTPRADVAEKKMLPVRAPGALWTRPKIATFVVFRRSEVKISGNVAYDDRIIVL